MAHVAATEMPAGDDGFITRRQLRLGLGISVLASACAMPWVAVALGMPLTMLMESLGGRAVMVGLIVTLQQLATVAQIPAALLAERLPNRKPLWFVSALLHRALWFVPVFLLLLPDPRLQWVRIVLLVLIAISSLSGQMSAPLWLSWMGDLVPERLRAGFWGKRQTVVMLIHLPAVYVVGRILDFYPDPRAGGGSFRGFQMVFLMAAVCGMADILIHTLVAEPRQKRVSQREAWWQRSLAPLRQPDFRWATLAFGGWMFSVGLVGSFSILYLTRVFGVNYSALSATLISASIGTALAGVCWGHLMQLMGTRTFCVLMLLLAPLLGVPWFFMQAGDIVIPVLDLVIAQPVAIMICTNLLAGAVYSGVGLSQLDMLVAITQPARRTMSMAVHWTIIGAVGAAGPVVGGLLTDWFVSCIDHAILMPTGTRFGFIHLLVIVQALVVWLLCVPALLKVRRLEHDLSIPAMVGNPLRAAALLWGLSSLTRADSRPERVKAVQRIGRQGDASVVAQLEAKLADADPDVREAAVAALGELGSDEAVQALVDRLRDEEEELAPQVARALRKARHPASVEALVQRLEQADREILTESARALGEIGDRRAVAPLRQLLKRTEDAKVVGASGEALARLNEFEAVYDLLPRMRATQRPTLRRSLAVALGDLMGHKDRFYALLSREEHDRGTVTGKLQDRIQSYIRQVAENKDERALLQRNVQAACAAYERGQWVQAANRMHDLVVDLARLLEKESDRMATRHAAARLMKSSPRLGIAFWFLADLAFWAEADARRIDAVDILLGLYVLSELRTA